MIDKPILELLAFGQKVANFVNAGFWRLRAPGTSILAPGGAFWPKRQFFAIFSNIWPLARPNIAKQEAAIEEKAPGRVRDGFGTGLGSR